MVSESVWFASDSAYVLVLDQIPEGLAATLVNLRMLVLAESGGQIQESHQGVISITILWAKSDDSFDGMIRSRARRIQFIAPGATFTDYLIIDRDIWVSVGNDFIDIAKK